MARTHKFRDLTGMSFGKYTVISHAGGNKWLCRCECGTEKPQIADNLINGMATMCRECYHKSRVIDMTGQRFGKWTVISLHKPKFWLCRCDCGFESVVSRGNLTSGGSTQCEKCRLQDRAEPKHGHCPAEGWSPTYQTWVSVKSRCTARGTDFTKHYGDAGICMCQGWQDSFPLFLELMGERTSQHLSIDRANTDESTRHYSCGQCDECKKNGWVFHCRWATRSEQSKNRTVPARNLYTFEGKTMSLKDWSTATGVPLSTLSTRIHVYKWPIEKALSTPRREYDKG